MSNFVSDLQIHETIREDQIEFSFEGEKIDFFVFIHLEKQLAKYEVRLFEAHFKDGRTYVKIGRVTKKTLMF